MLKHIKECFPKECQIVFIKSCLCCKRSGDKSVAAIESIRDCEFTAHCPIVTLLFFRLCFSGNCHTSDAVFKWDNLINASREGKLYRPAHLASILTC